MATTDKFPVVFLDRDGTIIVDKIFLNNPDEIEFLDGVIDGLKKLYDAGFKLVVVTNQSGIARGLVQLENLYAIHKKISEVLTQHGVEIYRYYFCPHMPDSGCECRKPNTGAVKEIINYVDKENSFMIGDKDTDVGFGKNLGVKTILLTTTDNIQGLKWEPDFIAKNFKEAVDIVLKTRKRSEL